MQDLPSVFVMKASDEQYNDIHKLRGYMLLRFNTVFSMCLKVYDDL